MAGQNNSGRFGGSKGVCTGTQRPVADTLQPAADAVTLSHCRFSIAVQPLCIRNLGEFVDIVTNHLQFILRERRMVRLQDLA